ncbi:hypothetical protein OC846_001423 [Tilletia horrida]|uniref:Peptidase A1 domain-containing protein n=1 Tax=Tilletia horrida TaxID=155126 RepID=A0AAN6GZ02_9BASI|nr:hypothetical protein OC845_001520 [Tilletia horrida]KAK0556093.1 hypothetical protein OC846_001423 [Tilletia horrida]KAK0568774.1 hypothetical protein OC861_001626 [Tilletia horrida]
MGQHAVADWNKIRASHRRVRHRYGHKAPRRGRHRRIGSQRFSPARVNPHRGHRQHHAEDVEKVVHYDHRPPPSDDQSTMVISKGGGAASEPSFSAKLVGTFHDDEAIHFLANVHIGTNPSPFQLLADTGSSVLWVKGQRASSTASHSDDGAVFRPKSSETCKTTGDTFKVAYTAGKVSGTVYRDTVSLGREDSQLSLSDVSFGVADRASADLTDDDSDGVLGLAPIFHTDGKSGSTILREIFKQGKEQGKMSRSVMSIFLGRPSSGTADRSEITFGGIHAEGELFHGPITYVPLLTTTHFWKFRAASFGVADAADEHTIGPVDAVIDTGTTLIHAPTAQAEAFWAGVPGAKKQGADTKFDSFWAFPCAQEIHALLKLPDGTAFSIASQDMNLGKVSAGSDQCVGALYALDGADFVLGEAALKSLYTVLDWSERRIGLARAIG